VILRELSGPLNTVQPSASGNAAADRRVGVGAEGWAEAKWDPIGKMEEETTPRVNSKPTGYALHKKKHNISSGSRNELTYEVKIRGLF